MSGQKFYCGTVKEKNGTYGPYLDVTINLDELGQAVRSGFNFKSESGKNLIRLQITHRKEVGKYGETHSITVNTWKPDNQQSGQNHGGHHQNQQQGNQPQGNRNPPQGQGSWNNNQGHGQNDRFEDDIPF